MHLDVCHLRDFYYRTGLGRAAQRAIRDQVLRLWPEAEAQTVIGFQGEGAGSKLLGILLGLLMIFLGVSLAFNPLEGVLSLALLVTIIFAFGGILRLVLAFQMKESDYFWPMLLSGAVSVLLAGFIAANFFEVAPQLLGILLGIELLFNGAGLIVLAFVIRKAGSA